MIGRIPNFEKSWTLRLRRGALRETRTPDPLITNQTLYQLSYEGSPRTLAGRAARVQSGKPKAASAGERGEDRGDRCRAGVGGAAEVGAAEVGGAAGARPRHAGGRRGARSRRRGRRRRGRPGAARRAPGRARRSACGRRARRRRRSGCARDPRRAPPAGRRPRPSRWPVAVKKIESRTPLEPPMEADRSVADPPAGRRRVGQRQRRQRGEHAARAGGGGRAGVAVAGARVEAVELGLERDQPVAGRTDRRRERRVRRSAGARGSARRAAAAAW